VALWLAAIFLPGTVTGALFGFSKSAAKRRLRGRRYQRFDDAPGHAARLIVEEALEGEARDAVGRDYYARGASVGAGYRNGYPDGPV
jgi:hypothetical protein